MNRKIKNFEIDYEALENIKKDFTKKNGVRALVLVGTLSLGAVFIGKQTKPIDEGIRAEAIEVDRMVVETTYDDIKDLHLVFANGGISDTCYQEVLEDLRRDNISFREHQDGLPVTEDETVISLTQNENVNGDIALYGPLYRGNNSNDALMMAFKSACINEKLEMEPIHFGRSIYGEMKQTSLEEEVGVDVPMITLQFDATPISSSQMSSLIENGIIRFAEIDNTDVDYFHVLQAGETERDVMNDYSIDDNTFYDYNGFAPENLAPIGRVIQIRGIDTYALDTNRTPMISNEHQKNI